MTTIDVPLNSDELHLLRLALLSFKRSNEPTRDPATEAIYDKIATYRNKLACIPGAMLCPREEKP